MSFTVTLTGDWSNYASYKRSVSSRFAYRIQTFLLREALIMRTLIVEEFPTQGKKLWKPLSPWTIANRRLRRFGGTKALIHSGQLMNSVTALWDPAKRAAFAGVLYQTRGKDGKSLVNLAKLHEYGHPGIVIRVSPRMRRFLFFLAKYLPAHRGSKTRRGAGAGKNMIVVRIPARPFMAPAQRMFLKTDVNGRMRRFFMGLLDYSGGGKK